MIRQLKTRVRHLERIIGADATGRPISTWREYGRALAAGLLADATLTPEMQAAVRGVIESRLRVLVRKNRGGCTE